MGRMRTKTVIVLLLIFFSVPFATALSLSGPQISPVTYRPGITMTAHYVVGGTNSPLSAEVDSGGIFSNITITPVINSEFDLFINFPEKERVVPGEYFVAVTVREVPAGQTATIGATVTVSKQIKFKVYSFEKDLQPSLSAFNINEGGNVTFTLGVQSVGYPDIEAVQGKIIVYNANKEKVGGPFITVEKPLKGLESISFTEVFAAHAQPVGSYSAEAVVTYDGKQKIVNTTFLIGNMDVLVKDYTKEVEQGFSEFVVRIASNWAYPLKNVYARLLVDGKELLQTPSINLEPWQEGELKAIMKVDLEPGTYNGLLKIFFEGAFKDIPVTLTVLPLAVVQEPPLPAEEKELQKPQSPFLTMFSSPLFAGGIVVIILIVILASIWHYRTRKRRQGGEF